MPVYCQDSSFHSWRHDWCVQQNNTSVSHWKIRLCLRTNEAYTRPLWFDKMDGVFHLSRHSDNKQQPYEEVWTLKRSNIVNVGKNKFIMYMSCLSTTTLCFWSYLCTPNVLNQLKNRWAHSSSPTTESSFSWSCWINLSSPQNMKDPARLNEARLQ